MSDELFQERLHTIVVDEAHCITKIIINKNTDYAIPHCFSYINN